MKNEGTLVIVLSLVVGLGLFIYNFIFLFSNYVSVISVVIVIIGPILIEYAKYKQNKDIEQRFPDFLRDVSENMKAGMTLPQAISAVKNTNYGSLTKYVKHMSLQINWGVPLDEVLQDFSAHSTQIIKRTVTTIIEAYRGGGNIADIFDSIGRNVIEINKIRAERSSSVYSQMVTGYVVFFVFLGVLVALQRFLLPSLISISIAGFAITTQEMTLAYTNMFKWLILLQGFFSGLAIGKMSEGNLIAGLKHSLFLIIVGYNILTFV